MMSEEQALLGAIEFTRGPMTKIPGWVADNAAICASVLLNTTAGAINGSMLEIGVFAGRFLSLLVLFTQSADELVVGLDPFVHHSENDVRNYISTSLNEINKTQFITKPTLIKGFSSEYNTRSLAELLIKNARFIHIDGSHEFDDVLWDLEQTEPLLMPGGIFCIDDFLTPYDVGVTEATMKFVRDHPSRIHPIAWAGSKLFLARPRFAPKYRAILEAWLKADKTLPASDRFRKRIGGGQRRMVEPTLFGQPVLIVT